MDLQSFLIEKFTCWVPLKPSVEDRSKNFVTLSWSQDDQPFSFLAAHALYRLERKDKLPPWVLVYSGGKTTKCIDNLAPRHPHKFRLRIILRASTVPRVADLAIRFYGSESNVFEKFNLKKDQELSNSDETDKEDGPKKDSGGDCFQKDKVEEGKEGSIRNDGDGNNRRCGDEMTKDVKTLFKIAPAWVASRWSDELWTSTDTDGTSAGCFCMAVKCAYIKQMQHMLEERPELIEVINSTNGLTPLITAVRKGDINTVRFLLNANADVNQKSASEQSPLHTALYCRHLPVAELLLERGADLQARDRNGLAPEHYAVDSGDLETVRFVLDKGGNLEVADDNGWTPLFRAITQGASTELIELLVRRHADLSVVDRAGLPLSSAARLLRDARGKPRDNILRLVDPKYPHEKAATHFTRLTKKITTLHSILK